MKQGLRSSLKMFLCAGVLTATCALAVAQDSSSQQPAPDNTKVNERDKNKAQPTADQQKENQRIASLLDRFADQLSKTRPYPAMRTTSKLLRKAVWSH
jgi:hypothetical protein